MKHMKVMRSSVWIDWKRVVIAFMKMKMIFEFLRT